ncbi:hypothetical protein Nepgr_016569 [Nepenthes gracilis]|uniref:Homeobox-leucine zipper protein n=1 Tax=Nepenthes gracilis TaxID=150966 RepID=A0AAD3XRR0_NEPGR|nr:hypothetical protein Nepgr_016569 [Nepenthes gracilis]
MAAISQLYPGLSIQVAPQRGESKPRGRKKRNKIGGNSGCSGGVGKKRKLSAKQVSMLEESFGCEQKLESERKDRLAIELGLDPRQVAVWFQNRRARWKNKKLEGDFCKLRSEHDSIVVEKCLLEAEVLKLKNQLNDAQKEILRLLQRSSSVSSNSPSSSFTMDAMDPHHLFGEFALESFEDMFHPAGSTCISSLEWVDIYDII